MVLIHVTVHSCRELSYPLNLPASNMTFPKPATFVELTCGLRKWRTKSVSMSPVPSWNEVIQLSIDENYYSLSGSLQVEVKCINTPQGLAHLGRARVCLKHFQSGQVRKEWHALCHTCDPYRPSSIHLSILLVYGPLEKPRRIPVSLDDLPAICFEACTSPLLRTNSRLKDVKGSFRSTRSEPSSPGNRSNASNLGSPRSRRAVKFVEEHGISEEQRSFPTIGFTSPDMPSVSSQSHERLVLPSILMPASASVSSFASFNT